MKASKDVENKEHSDAYWCDMLFTPLMGPDLILFYPNNPMSIKLLELRMLFHDISPRAAECPSMYGSCPVVLTIQEVAQMTETYRSVMTRADIL